MPSLIPFRTRHVVRSWVVRCPGCGTIEDKVIDSRLADEGAAVRRRRECLNCGRRFTTFERFENVPMVLKRSGARAPFDRSKIVKGVLAATKNRPVSEEQVKVLADDIEEMVRTEPGAVTTQQLGISVLDRLRALDDVAYMRFASVYKGFVDLTDFEREAGLLIKETAPKARP